MNLNSSTWTLQWSHGVAQVQALGGMLGPVDFKLSEKQTVQPFAIFPWADEVRPANEQALTGLLARGRGEWPCVPFGVPPEDPHSTWKHPIHGDAANGLWRRTDDAQQAGFIKLEFIYPQNSPISHVERELTAVDGEPLINCKLTVHANADCRLPIGLHPVLRLPHQPGMLRLLPGHYQFARSYPGEVEPHGDLVDAQRYIHDLAITPKRGGGHINLLKLPMPEQTESLIQLCGCDGRMSVANLVENYCFQLQWDAQQLPSCLLWFSNAGRAAWPWMNRHYALGIEPVCAYFDQGIEASLQVNDISDRGIPTNLLIKKSKPWTIQYSMRVTELPHAMAADLLKT